jgi:hypothetical protein
MEKRTTGPSAEALGYCQKSLTGLEVGTRISCRHDAGGFRQPLYKKMPLQKNLWVNKGELIFVNSIE